MLKKKLISALAAVIAVVMLLGASPAFAMSPPDYYFVMNGIEELIYWIKIQEVVESDSWGSWYYFINAVREKGSILSVGSNSEEYPLTEIMVQSNLSDIQYTFGDMDDNGDNSIYVSVKLRSAMTLEEEAAIPNEGYLQQHEEFQFRSKTVKINGNDITAYCSDGGEYYDDENDVIRKKRPAAMFDLMGFRVMVVGDRNKYDSKWDDAYFEMLTFTEISLDDRIVPFADVKEDDWFYGDVEYAYKNGIMNGVDTDKFAPNGTLTRAMAVTMLYRMAGEPDVAEVSRQPFDDVPLDEWYTNAVVWARRKDIVNGYSEKEFGPDDNITRADFATMLFRYAFNSFVMFPALDSDSGNDGISFSDRSEIPSYAELSVKLLSNAKVIGGKDNGVFDPKAAITRAEAAAMLHRYDLNVAHYRSAVLEKYGLSITEVSAWYDHQVWAGENRPLREHDVRFTLNKIPDDTEMQDITISGKITFHGSTIDVPFYPDGQSIKADEEYLRQLPERIQWELDPKFMLIELTISDGNTSETFSCCSSVSILG